MRLDNWLKQATKQLDKAGIGTARLDCLVLLEDCLHKNRAQLLAELERELTDEQQNWLARRLKCRADHEPLAYIRGKTEFYGREFVIKPGVLEPRPESETMIDLLKGLPRPKTIIDVGTGSGALGITAAIELQEVQVFGIDIDQQCLELARTNADQHKTTIVLRQGDLLKDFETPEGSMVLANLPYVPDDYQINSAALHEPRLAIFGGADGLDLYRKLFKQAVAQQQPPTHILTESLPFQHTELAKIAKDNSYQLTKTEDFIQLFSWSA